MGRDLLARLRAHNAADDYVAPECSQLPVGRNESEQHPRDGITHQRNQAAAATSMVCGGIPNSAMLVAHVRRRSCKRHSRTAASRASAGIPSGEEPSGNVPHCRLRVLGWHRNQYDQGRERRDRRICTTQEMPEDLILRKRYQVSLSQRAMRSSRAGVPKRQSRCSESNALADINLSGSGLPDAFVSAAPPGLVHEELGGILLLGLFFPTRRGLSSVQAGGDVCFQTEMGLSPVRPPIRCLLQSPCRR
jgi:hypothetical protein